MASFPIGYSSDAMKGHARDLMSSHVAHTKADASLLDLARALAGGEHGGLPVLGPAGEVVGFVSATDVMGALLEGRDVTTPASAIMTSPAETIDEFATSDEVMSVLRDRRIHHLPVVRAGRLVGMISPGKILGYFVSRVAPTSPEAG